MTSHVRAALFAIVAAGMSGTPRDLRAQGNAAQNATQNATQNAAQSATQGNGALAAVDSLIARSRFRDAASALDAWERAHSNRMAPADRASVLMLHARLTNSADSARGLYLAVSAGYPSSAEAPLALLRLGQLAVTDDDSLRAISYFQRIVTNYPTAPIHDDAVAWLAKMKSSPRASAPIRDSTPRAGAPIRDSTPRPSNSVPPRANKSVTQDDSSAVHAGSGAYALQVAAFQDARSAATVARLLAKRGFDARVVTVPGNTLTRVRVGRFAAARDANDVQRRLHTAGYDAVVVDDARSETGTSKD